MHTLDNFFIIEPVKSTEFVAIKEERIDISDDELNLQLSDDANDIKLNILPNFSQSNPLDTSEANQPPPQPTKKIHERYHIHTRMELYCPMCTKVYAKRFGQKLTHCPTCVEWLYSQCLKCKRRYRQYNDMTMHLKYACGQEKRYTCKLCQYKTSRTDRINDHMRAVHPESAPEGDFKCEKCGKTYKLRRYLTEHMNTVCNESTQFVCKYCGFETKYRKSLTNHVKNRHERDDSVSFDCRNCGKIYRTKAALKKHVDTVCGKTPSLECEHCEYKTYHKYPLLAKHMQRQHPGIYGKNEFYCRYCKTNYHCTYDLNNHLKNAPICALKENLRCRKKNKK